MDFSVFFLPATLINGEKIGVGKFVKIIVASDTVSGMGHLWFVGYIAFCYALTPILQFLCQGMLRRGFYKYLKSVGIICLISIIYNYTFGCYFSAIYVLCYILGYFIAAAIKNYGSYFIKYKRMMLITLLIASTTICFLRYYLDNTCAVNSGITSYCRSALRQYGHIAVGITIFFLLIIIYDSCAAIKKENISRFFSFSDKISYDIYMPFFFGYWPIFII